MKLSHFLTGFIHDFFDMLLSKKPNKLELVTVVATQLEPHLKSCDLLIPYPTNDVQKVCNAPVLPHTGAVEHVDMNYVRTFRETASMNA